MILLVFVFNLIMLLIPLGSTYAFAAITSISTIGYQLSYTIPLVLRLRSTKFQQVRKLQSSIVLVIFIVMTLKIYIFLHY
jgi:hypothetical protein